ncbi:MAG: nucleotidyltransferase domain-containing protein [Oscillospiraceae bacterium]|jgi:predicted nucleotidyltransferase|nr:nucleotidyltransferase domain-containing protein [Oscillospiraceae bacterium]
MVADIETVNAVATDYANLIRSLYPVEKAYLFGSYAKGCPHKDSDVDICFFLRDFGGRPAFDVDVEIFSLSHRYDLYLEPHVMETSDLTNDNPFVKEILRTGYEI